ncbi:SRPBCC domain-containing protein [Pseudomonas sp. SB113]
MTWSVKPVDGGTEVSLICENVPAGIRAEDHAEGLSSTLDNLAAFVCKSAL